MTSMPSPDAVLAGRPQARHVRRLPERPGHPVPWPDWVPADLRTSLAGRGIDQPWSHQAEAAEL